MNEKNTFSGQCFCGAVQFTVTGEPAVQGYCHCESCRHWSASPVNALTLWPRERRDHQRHRRNRHVPQNRPEPSQVVQRLRRSCLHRSSRNGAVRYLRRDHSELPIPPHFARAVRRKSTAHPRWSAEIQGLSKELDGSGRHAAGVAHEKLAGCPRLTLPSHSPNGMLTQALTGAGDFWWVFLQRGS